MKCNEIRKKFLDYFNENQHKVISSSSLVPFNDPSLLFVNSGMVQFKDVFLGKESVNYKRAITVQRCLRAGGKHNDLENVGYTARHHTFFEMMGNFSFGDYFKKEAINFAWNFLTKELKLPKEKLWITVFKDDNEAASIWLNEIKIPKDRLSRCGEKDNFWSMGDTGPCGPCSEIFYDHGENVAGGPPGSPDEDGDRYIEIWNLVFMQFNRDKDGNMTKLPKPSVDTGMGLERLTAVLQHVNSNYEIDLFQNLMCAIAKILKIENSQQTSLKVIADHIRSCAFLVVDDVLPSNEGRGYVLRRIIRRAIRHGHKLGYKKPFFYKIIESLIKEMGEAYPELKQNQKRVEDVLKQEEIRFAETVEQGIKILSDYISSSGSNTIDGKMAFKLYDTYGFPFDLTQDIAREYNIKVNKKGFDEEMEKQRQRARQAGGFKIENTLDLNLDFNTEFLGYKDLKSNSNIKKILVNGKEVNQLKTGTDAIIVLDKTPFYAESGGQVADKGVLGLGDNQFIVDDVQKNKNTIIHFGKLKKGYLKVNDKVIAEINQKNRLKTACNHSATHLLHAALRKILGNHVNQKGSLVNDNKIRFDFSHNTAITKKQLKEIEDLINKKIQETLAVETSIMNLDDAKEKGAMALFGEKYSDKVRVLSMGDFSVELCGGTHIKNTADIGLFKITGESSIATGIRRIEAVSGDGAIELLQQSHQKLDEISKKLKTNNKSVLEKLELLLKNNEQLEKQILEYKNKIAKNKTLEIANLTFNIGDVKILVKTLEDADGKSLRSMLDDLKSRLNKSVILLASINNDKISVICGVTNNLTNKIKASQIMQNITEQIDGKGGGRDDMAQGGGTNIANLKPAMQKTENWIKQQLP